MIEGLSYITNFIALSEQEFLIKEIDKLSWLKDLKRRTYSIYIRQKSVNKFMNLIESYIVTDDMRYKIKRRSNV